VALRDLDVEDYKNEEGRKRRKRKVQVQDKEKD